VSENNVFKNFRWGENMLYFNFGVRL
jgi:hypothetical protein